MIDLNSDPLLRFRRPGKNLQPPQQPTADHHVRGTCQELDSISRLNKVRSRDRVEDRRLAVRARYQAPAVGLPPWYRFAINELLLRYIAGGGERYTN
jgi:hypothetical protein